MTSERLGIARVLCILGMIWVHVPGGAPDGAGRALELADPSATLQAFLVEGMGRSSAALLSVVSGWLCARLLLGGRAPRALIGARVRTILVPMLFWGAVTVALYAVLSLARPTFLSVHGPVDAATLRRWIDSVAFLTSAPSGPTLHLSFLRDLFVCTCLAPLLLALLGRRAHAWPLLLALGIVYVADLESVIVMRPLVLFAFALGMWVARSGTALDAADAWLPAWLALSVCATLGVMLANGGAFASLDARLGAVGLDLRESVLYPSSRLFGSLAVWALTARLVGTRAGRAVAAQMPWLFTTYCSHFLVLALLWTGLLHPLGAGGDAPGFTLWFLGAPLVSLAVGRTLVRVALAWWPPGAALLGVRAPRPAVYGGDGPAGRPRTTRTVREIRRRGAPAPTSRSDTATHGTPRAPTSPGTAPTVPSDSKSCLVTYLSNYIDLDDDQLGLIAALEREERTCEADVRVHSRGDRLQNLYVVKSGWLYLSTDMADGRRHIVRTHHAGDVIGLSDLAHREVTANLTACTRAVLCPFPKRALDQVLVRAPRLTALLMAMSARDQVLYIDMLRATARMSARERVIFLLLTLLHRLRMTVGGDADGFDLPLNQTHVGDLLGLTNVSVSKAMVELEQGGAIERHRQHVRLLDVERSTAEVDFVDRFGELDTSWFPSLGSG